MAQRGLKIRIATKYFDLQAASHFLPSYNGD